MKPVKNLLSVSLILVLGSAAASGQKYLEPLFLRFPQMLGETTVKGVERSVMIDGVIKGAIPVVTGNFLLETGALPSLHLDDLDVTYIRSSDPGVPNQVIFEPIVYPPAKTYQVGPHPVTLSPAAGIYKNEITQAFNRTLSDTQFPVYGPLDKQFTAQVAADYVKQIDVISVWKNQFRSSLRSDIVRGNFPYERFLPFQKTDVIYLGISHERMIENDTVNWVRAIARKYPTRNIYFATEYVWDNLVFPKDDQVVPVKIVRTKEELLYRMDSIAEYKEYAFLQRILDLNVAGEQPRIAVVGVEPATTMLAKVEQESPFRLSDRLLSHRLVTLSTSEVGMAKRNEIWAAHIRQILEQDENALVVVCGGAKHMEYSSRFSLPSLLSDLNGFAIAQVSRRGKVGINPVLTLLDDENYRSFVTEVVNKGPLLQARYVLQFKSPTPDGRYTPEELAPFKQAVGADVVVVMP